MRNDTSRRLVECFSIVFADLDEGEVTSASLDTVENWDSLATMNLISLVEEEFGCSVDVEEMERFTSFLQIVQYLEERMGS